MSEIVPFPTKQYIKTLTNEEVVTAYAKAAGKQAPLYDAVCKVCEQSFTVKVFTALAQLRKYRRFVPPRVCAECYDVTKGVSVPNPPGNAVIAHKQVLQSTVPAELSQRELAMYRRKWEGKFIVLTFKPVVSFSSEDESDAPETGECLGVSTKTITILGKGEEAHNARTFKLADISRIEFAALQEKLEQPAQPALEWKTATTPETSTEPDKGVQTPAA